MKAKHLYLHVPFCKTICGYCDFCHRLYDENIANKWLERVHKEIIENCEDQYETIYIGGGTPSSLSDKQMDSLLFFIKPFSLKAKEYTIEVNPESLSSNKIIIFQKYGINRISMGVQSTNKQELDLMNRHADFEVVKEKIALLKENGISNISVDLMYSLPNQTLSSLEKSLNDILSLDIPHISIYSFTVEDHTFFKAKGLQPLDDEIEADMYEFIEKKLEENGYLHYEVSNYCKQGYESKHNMSYWLYEDFLGISMAAASKIGNRRFCKTRSFEQYLQGENIIEEDLFLSQEELEFENIMMSLRSQKGLDIATFNKRYQVDLLDKYKKGVSNSAIVIENGHLRCNNLAILNHVLLDFMLE